MILTELVDSLQKCTDSSLCTQQYIIDFYNQCDMKAVYIFSYSRIVKNKSLLISKKMPVQLNRRYMTRSCWKNHQQPPPIYDLPTRPKRALRSNKPTPPPNIDQHDVFFSDEELPTSNPSKKVNGSHPEVYLEQNDSSDGMDSNIQQVVKRCRPPKKKGKKCKVEPARQSAALKQRQRKIVKEMDRMVSKTNNPHVIIPIVQPVGKMKETRPKKLEQMMIEQQNLSDKPTLPTYQEDNVTLKAQREEFAQEQQRKKIEEEMELLARMDFCNKGSSIASYPFNVLGQYRSNFQSVSKLQYRQFLKAHDFTHSNWVKQNMDFRQLQEMEAGKQFRKEPKGERVDSFRQYKEANDIMFYKCRDMDKAQMLQYMRSKEYYEEMLRINPIFQGYNSELSKYESKAKKLKIDRTVNETFNIVVKKEPIIPLHRSNPNIYPLLSKPADKLHPPSQIFKLARSNQTPAPKTPPFYQTKIQQTFEPPLPQHNNLQLKPQQFYASNIPQPTLDIPPPEADIRPEIPRCQDETPETARVKIQPCKITPKADANCEPSLTESQLKQYQRSRIMGQISKLNRMCNLEQKLTFMQEQRQKLSMASYIPPPKSIPHPAGNQLNDTAFQSPFQHNHPSSRAPSTHSNQQMLSVDSMQPKLQGVGEIEIVTHQSGEKTEPTKPQNFSYHSREDSKGNNLQSWDGSHRGPKIKRLEILNRYHYNPFEQGNSEDQCDLWKRLMSEQINDLRSHFKLQQLNEYNGFNDSDMQKGNNVLTKIKEQDFFVPNRYDPDQKMLKQESYYMNQNAENQSQIWSQNQMTSRQRSDAIQNTYVRSQLSNGIVKKQESVVQKSSINTRQNYRQIVNHMIEQHAQQQRLAQQQSNKENNHSLKRQQLINQQSVAKSFNFDLLQDFQIPQLNKTPNDCRQSQFNEINISIKKQAQPVYDLDFL